MFNALRETTDCSLVDIAQEGFRRTGEVLAPFVALLWPTRQQQAATVEDDEFPPDRMVGEVPAWAYDLYSREGRAALANFIEGRTETARWVRDHIPPRQRVPFLGGVVFRVDGGLVRKRLRWKAGDELRRMVDVGCNGPHCRDATEILHLMKADIPTLNEVRAELMGGLRHV
jgi:hypothetical protein